MILYFVGESSLKSSCEKALYLPSKEEEITSQKHYPCLLIISLAVSQFKSTVSQFNFIMKRKASIEDSQQPLSSPFYFILYQMKLKGKHKEKFI